MHVQMQWLLLKWLQAYPLLVKNKVCLRLNISTPMYPKKDPYKDTKKILNVKLLSSFVSPHVVQNMYTTIFFSETLKKIY